MLVHHTAQGPSWVCVVVHTTASHGVPPPPPPPSPSESSAPSPRWCQSRPNQPRLQYTRGLFKTYSKPRRTRSRAVYGVPIHHLRAAGAVVHRSQPRSLPKDISCSTPQTRSQSETLNQYWFVARNAPINQYSFDIVAPRAAPSASNLEYASFPVLVPARVPIPHNSRIVYAEHP